MKLSDQQTLLEQGGFSQKEIEDWKKDKILKLNNAGFSNAEILEEFGVVAADNKANVKYFKNIKEELENEYYTQESISPDDELFSRSTSPNSLAFIVSLLSRNGVVAAKIRPTNSTTTSHTEG